jgi:TRAP transporter 4TM/12TM fusion protein
MAREENEGHFRTLRGRAALVVATASVLWVSFHIVTAGLGMLPNYQQRAVHLGGALALAFILYRASPSRDSTLKFALDLALAAASIGTLAYVFVNYDVIVTSTWYTNPTVEKIFGVVLFALVIEAVRRTLGWLFVGLIALFVLYGYLGPYFPGVLGHRGLSFDRLVYSFYLGENGILGSLMGISATVVTLFLILGALINVSGAGDTFIRIAMRLGGRMRGGAGMVAVIGSAFMGMINGSTVANVTSTGVLTIPLMRRLGFKRDLAGAIEAVASTGGQIMPPVMGPGAFLMAELLGISYLEVVKAALVPSLLFFAALLIGVYLFARKYDLAPLPPALIPSRADAYAPWPLASLLVPVGILVYLIVNYYTIQFAVFWSVIAILAMMVLATLVPTRRPRPEGMLPTPVAGLVLDPEELAEKPPAQISPPARLSELGPALFWGLNEAARGVVYIAMIIAAAQIIVSLINLTGLGITFSQIIVALGQNQLLLSLVLTMAITIVLGMGMPTPAAYAVGAAVLGPPLASLGFDLLPSHLFLYFFASLSAITPPVAAGVFAAVAISNGTFVGTARYALLLSCSLFIIPFMFIFHSELTLEGELSAILPALLTASAGIVFISLATIGTCVGRIGVVPRLLMGLGALTLIIPGWTTDIAGAVLASLGLLLHLRAARTRPAEAQRSESRPTSSS